MRLAVTLSALLVASAGIATPAAACNLEAEMTELGHYVPQGRIKDENWFNLYSQQFGDVMKHANQGDMAGACEKIEDLIEWVHRNPAPK